MGRFAALPVLLAGLTAASPVAAQAPARLVAAVGGLVPAGPGVATVTSLNLPFDDGSGGVGFTGSLDVADSTEGFVFHDDAVRWRNSDAPVGTSLVGREVWMGVASGGPFIYSTSIDGADGLWTDLGRLARRGDAAPGRPGEFLSFTSRPGLTSSGGAYWMAGLATTPDGATESRAFYTSPDRTAGLATVAIAEGDLVNGVPVTALDFNYAVSSNGSHRMFLLTRATGSTQTDDTVVLDGAVVAQETHPVDSPSGETWASFDLVQVNDEGHYLIAGDSNGQLGADEIVVYDGAVALREGDIVEGVTLGAEVLGVGLRNDGYVVWAWTGSSGSSCVKCLFVGQATDLASTSQLVVGTGMGIDITGDGSSDATVTDFEFSSADGHAALSFGPGHEVFVRLELFPTEPPRTAIVGLDLSAFLPSAGEPTAPAASATLDVAPNPFREGVEVSLVVGRAGPVTVEVLDVLGRRVALLHDGRIADGAPLHLSLSGSGLPSGLYVVRASGADWAVVRRVVRGS